MSPEPGASSRQYDFPLFCSLWLPLPAASESEPAAEDSSTRSLILLGGGGGAGAHGVKNRLALVEYDADAQTLTEEVCGTSTGADAAQAAAVHPDGTACVVAFSDPGRMQVYPLQRTPQPELSPPTDVGKAAQAAGEQRALAFNPGGDKLAAGGQDGSLHVFKWPDLQQLVHLKEAHGDAVRCVDWSEDGRLLASSSQSRSCPVWDVSKEGELVATLQAGQGCVISSVLFSRNGPPRVFMSVVSKGKGFIHVYDAATWQCIKRKQVQRDPISAFALSPDGRQLATASAEGDVMVLGARQLDVRMHVRRAHHLFITGLDFAPDSRSLLSISADSSARVTHLQEREQGISVRDFILALIVAIIGALLALYLQRG